MSAWIVSKHHIDVLVDGAVRLGVIYPEDRLIVGRMLTNANKKSIRTRYGYDDEGAARVKTYRYSPSGHPISDVALYKQVGCYDYQTCEFDGYEKSEAYKFVHKMQDALAPIGYLSPGYDEAPWGV